MTTTTTTPPGVAAAAPTTTAPTTTTTALPTAAATTTTTGPGATTTSTRPGTTTTTIATGPKPATAPAVAPPTAVLTASPTSGRPPLTVTFDGSQSRTSDPSVTIASWRLDFGDGTPPATGIGPPPSPTATHTYTADFYADAILTVTDSTGATDSAEVDINIGISPVDVNLFADPDFGLAPLEVTFFAFVDPSPGTSITSYTLDFGDGTTPMTGKEPPPEQIPHTYAAVGKYTAELTVTQSNGASGSARAFVEATAVQLSLQASPTSGLAPLPVILDTTGTTVSPGASITSWTLDFEGDGTPDRMGTGPVPPTVAHTYPSAGHYFPTLTATDSSGVTRSTSSFVSVFAVNAELQAKPPEGPAPLDVTFDTTGTVAAAGSSTTWTFDFGDRTSPLTGTGLPPTTIGPHRYQAGFYFPRLTVTDSEGHSDSAGATVDAFLVRADLEATPESGTAPLTVTFDTTGTFVGPGSSITAFELHFEDGEFIAGPGPPPDTVTYTYTEACSCFAELFLEVNNGDDFSSDFVRITVLNPPPVADLTAAPTFGNAPLQVTFNGSASSAPPGVTITSYTLDFGDGSPALVDVGPPPSPTAVHTYSAPGTYTATLLVEGTGCEPQRPVPTFDGDFGSGDVAASPLVVAAELPPCSGIDSVQIVVRPPVAVTKTATPASLPAPGGTFTFGVVVTNGSTVPVTITALADDVYGDLATRPGSNCGALIGTTLAAGASSSPCTFPGAFTGSPGASQTDGSPPPSAPPTASPAPARGRPPSASPPPSPSGSTRRRRRPPCPSREGRSRSTWPSPTPAASR